MKKILPFLALLIVHFAGCASPVPAATTPQTSSLAETPCCNDANCCSANPSLSCNAACISNAYGMATCGWYTSNWGNC